MEKWEEIYSYNGEFIRVGTDCYGLNVSPRIDMQQGDKIELILDDVSLGVGSVYIKNSTPVCSVIEIVGSTYQNDSWSIFSPNESFSVISIYKAEGTHKIELKKKIS